MCCTFGDLTDVDLVARAAAAGPGDHRPRRPGRSASGRSWISDADAWDEIAGQDHLLAPGRPWSRLLRASGDLDGEPTPTQRKANFYEKGDKPLEIVSTRQWYIRNGGRDPELKQALLARGEELAWVPPHMKYRYDNWVGGLNGDWLISRQRFFGVPFPVWYPLDADGEPRYDQPILPARTSCRSTPAP